jgi:hypothetical protein
MQRSNTHFEQIPLEIVKKNVEDQSRREESAGQMLILQKEIKVDVKPKDHAA